MAFIILSTCPNILQSFTKTRVSSLCLMGSVWTYAVGTNGDDAVDADVERRIKIRVVAEGMDDLYFAIKKTTKLMKLMKAYSLRKKIPLRDLRFDKSGKRIDRNQVVTAESVGLSDRDVITVTVISASEDA